MKKLLLLTFVLACCTQVATLAQTHKYERSGMTILHTDYQDRYDDEIDYYFANYRPSGRYDLNQLTLQSIQINEDRDHFRSGTREYTSYNYANSILAYLNRTNVGLDVVAKMFNRQPDGRMDISLMEERGLYNATDEEYIQSVATKRGLDQLKDFGENLIAHSYITVMDYQNIRYQYSTEEGDEEGEYYWMGNAIGYLYQIDWSLELLDQVYDCWIQDDDNEETIAQKNAAFEKIQVPFKLILTSVCSLKVDTDIESSQRAYKTIDVDRQKEKKFYEMLKEGTNTIFWNFEEQHARFQLKVGVYETHPVRAKLGSKEGLYRDMVFYVYENVADANNQIRQKRVGVIAVSNEIADNRHVASGESELTRFYRIAGGRVEPGQSITEKKFRRLAFELAGARYAGNGGVLGARFGVEGDMYGGRYGQIFYGIDINILEKSVNAGARVGYGVRVNNFQLYPYVGANYDMLYDSSDNEEKTNKAWYLAAGLKMNVNIWFPVWLTCNVGYSQYLMGGALYEASGVDLTGLYMTAGLRYYF